MKKIFFALLILISPVCMNAQVDALFEKTPSEKKVITRTDIGTIPMENGKVVFRKEFNAPGKSTRELYANLAYWVGKRFEQNAKRGTWTDENYFQNLAFATVKEADKTKGTVVCQGAEELVFKNSFLSKNWTECYYIAKFQVEEGKISVTISNIAYIYAATDMKERIPAEEWITDSEVLDKNGKVRKNPGKFRVKTIAMVNQMFKELEIITK